MNLKFVNRQQELKFLEDHARKKSFEFIVIYGRRRVGKTSLLEEFLKNKEHVYFLCDKGGSLRNIERFKQLIATTWKQPLLATTDWEELFKIPQLHNTIIVLDEFPYLVEKDHAIPSIFQVIIDTVLSKTSTMFIVSGSSMSMMERGVLSYASPLYGRKTGHWKVQELSLHHMHKFVPTFTFEEVIEMSSVVGGIPFYARSMQHSSVRENIVVEIMNKTGRLYEETDFLLMEEFREPDVYKAVFQAMANGRTKSNDIANASKIPVQDIDKYLKALITLRMIEKIRPIGIQTGKKTVYRIIDPFLRFWFRFCEPFKSYLEKGDTSLAIELLDKEFNAFVGRHIEFVVREYLPIILPGNYTDIGTWWGKVRDGKEIEIDICAIGDRIILGESKWSSEVDGEKLAMQLYSKYQESPWKEKRVEFLLIAKTFRTKVKKVNEIRVHCIDIKQLELALKK